MPSGSSSQPPASPLASRLLRGEVLLLDGAMGTELGRRGVATPLPLWSAQALLDAPEVVAAVHEDYARAGADILTTATFRATPRAWRAAGRGGDADREAERLARLAVDLARKGRAASGRGGVLVAGGMAPLEDCYRADLAPTQEIAAAEHAKQAAILADAGVDLLLVETMNTIGEAVAATEAAMKTGLPVLVSFITKNESEIWSGEPLEKAVSAVDALQPDAVLVNCFPAPTAAACLEAMAHATRTPIGCYPNAGHPDLDQGTWRDDTTMTPERFASLASTWLGYGASIIGGCCGTTPDHIRALRAAAPPVLLE